MGDSVSRLFGGGTPAPPNPMLTGALQTATNVNTAIAGAYLNQPSQVTPNGNLTWSQAMDSAGKPINYSWTDPAGVSYSVPQFTATQTQAPWMTTPGWSGFSPVDNERASQYNLGEAARKGSWDVMNLLNAQFSPVDDANTWAPLQNISGVMGAPDAQTGFTDVGGPATTFGEAGDITRSYGPADSFSADRGRVEEALYGRLNPQLDRERANIEQRLADQGIRYGSPAYNQAMDDYNRQANDARLAVTQTAGTEQQRLMQMAGAQAAFQNEAQQQAYQQALMRGQFGNQAQQQAFTQAAARSEFYNNAIQQNLAREQAKVAAQENLHKQYLSEQWAQRNQKINEVSALMSGSQVQQPQWAQTPNNQIATTDIAGLVNNRFSQELSNYKASSENFNQMMGGIFGMMGGVLSDRRAKEDIDKVGTIFAAGPDGEKPLPVYEYSYKADPAKTRHVGPMAQDVEKIDKRAVKSFGGVKYIDKTKMGSILKAA